MEKDESHEHTLVMSRSVPRFSVSVKCSVVRPLSVIGKLEKSYRMELAKGN